MKKLHLCLLLVLTAAVVFPTVRELVAQDNSAGESETAEVVPRAALLTERGRQLSSELRILLESRKSLGEKHPSMPIIKQKIEAIKEQLRAWEPAMGAPAPNPFQARADDSATAKSRTADSATANRPQMNEYDLRQVVIRLTKRVAALEKRVSDLESQ
jgi:uncharacterized membrane protein YdfJ with MMPL/SSD domain